MTFLSARLRLRSRLYQLEQRVFDWRYGTDTTGITRAHYVDVDEEGRRRGTRYEATPRRAFHLMLRSVHLDYSRFTFIDLGCGKGAVLLYASELPFRRIQGIEISRTLYQIAQANIHVYASPRQRCKRVSVVCGDAATYLFPQDPLLLYLYNPFDAEILSRVFSNVRRSLLERQREIVLISANPDAAFHFSELEPSGPAPIAASPAE